MAVYKYCCTCGYEGPQQIHICELVAKIIDGNSATFIWGCVCGYKGAISDHECRYPWQLAKSTWTVIEYESPAGTKELCSTCLFPLWEGHTHATTGFSKPEVPPVTLESDHYASDCYCVSCFSSRVSSGHTTPLDLLPGTKTPSSAYLEYEVCMDCNWRMGDPARECSKPEEPHVFPSTLPRVKKLRDELGNWAEQRIFNWAHLPWSENGEKFTEGQLRSDLESLARRVGVYIRNDDERGEHLTYIEQAARTAQDTTANDIRTPREYGPSGIGQVTNPHGGTPGAAWLWNRVYMDQSATSCGPDGTDCGQCRNCLGPF